PSSLLALVLRASSFVLATVLLGSLLSLTSSAKPAEAAVASNFDPGYIISDRLFYDGSLMPQAAIQAFLQSKVSCGSGAGRPGCLAGYRSDSSSRAADKYCSAYTGGAGELASAILYNVSIACNINPQVLIVMLQKEQGLVTASDPSLNSYRSAMGYGCPDTAACDAVYYGFANQVYSAARQLNAYAKSPQSFRYHAGIVNSILTKPAAGCPSQNVFIQNTATAGLYNYTPYVPDAWALASLYGEGHECSSYGNRNFWVYFTDWFGSTTITQGAISFAKSVYVDVLGRTAGDSEVTFWGRLLMGGTSTTSVASGFVNSDEYRLQRITAAYRGILGRNGDVQGIANWLSLMQQGVLQTDDVDKYFLASDEYRLASGGTDSSFVSALYLHLLGRPITAGEIPFWTNISASSGRLAVVDGIWHSMESARSRITAMYFTYLGRYPDEAGLANWASIAIDRGDASVRWQLIGSQEYWNRAASRFPL
ncbi:MAG: DUF4214 domain-containing protein, partial [Candidatus Saccharibacteria bacterium]|nr:DUF4214 domain-containing protein [Microbacteriaceae bacterium]